FFNKSAINLNSQSRGIISSMFIIFAQFGEIFIYYSNNYLILK
ncbi:MAG: hypothetical protein ACI9ZX_001938, partial [Algoriphagus sp.]